MRSFHTSALAITLGLGLTSLSILLISGCGDADSPSASSASASPAPITPSAEDVRADAKQHKDAVDREYHAQTSAMKLRVQQLKDTAAQKGAQADLNRDKEVQPLEITMQGLVDGMKQEKDAVDADAAQKLKEPGNQEVAIKADQKRRKEEIELKGSGKMNEVTVKIDHAKAVALEKHQDTDRNLTANLKVEQQKILSDERSARHREIDIDYDAQVKLDVIKHTAAAQSEQVRQEQLRSMEKDMKISQTIRDGLASDASMAVPSKDVEIATTNGVVDVSGTVSSESDRRAIIAVATKTNGVQRVNDQLAVK